MKLVLPALFFFAFSLKAQTFQLTVSNGYGSGQYLAGDTVHVWSKEYDNTKTFDTWTGDIQYLLRPREWHTTLIMPQQSVHISASIIDMPVYSIKYEQIRGAENLKNVFFFFPDNLKGVIYLFHGTGGEALGWFDKVESRSFVNAAIADNFGILATDAEEVTLDSDVSGDGFLRWNTLPVDTFDNVDYVNIKAITDTFITRGYFDHSTPRFSVGMSNGGYYSSGVSAAYNLWAGVSYCSASSALIFSHSNTPFAFRMAKYDNHPDVGIEGNMRAMQYDALLESRGVIHDYQENDRQPIYPERFAREAGISLAISRSIFDELQKNNQLNDRNYTIPADSVLSNILANPSAFPVLASLDRDKQVSVFVQLAVSNAEHNFYSDLNRETLEFFNQFYGSTTSIEEYEDPESLLHVFPNPTSDSIVLDLADDSYIVSIFNRTGRMVKYYTDLTGQNAIDLTDLGSGWYFILAVGPQNVLMNTFIKH